MKTFNYIHKSSVNELQIYRAKKIEQNTKCKYIIVNQKKVYRDDYIKKIVSMYLGLPIKQIMSNTRKREIVESRQIGMWLSKKYTDASLQSIGDDWGNKNYTTVIHACKAINNLLETDRTFREKMSKIEEYFL